MPITPEQMIEALRDCRLRPRAYSGRGMYGRYCVGVTTDGPFEVGVTLGAHFCLNGIAPDEIPGPSTDSMGQSTILYWPGLKWPEGMKDDEDEDDELPTLAATGGATPPGGSKGGEGEERDMRVSKEDQKMLRTLDGLFHESMRDLAEKIDEYNASVKEAWQNVEAALESANEKRDTLRDFITSKADEMTERIDGKSDKWQESDAGQNAAAQRDTWQEKADEYERDICLDEPEEVEDPSSDFPEEGDPLNLPMKPEDV